MQSSLDLAWGLPASLEEHDEEEEVIRMGLEGFLCRSFGWGTSWLSNSKGSLSLHKGVTPEILGHGF